MMNSSVTQNSSNAIQGIGPSDFDGFWIETEHHQSWLKADAVRQLNFFRSSYNSDGGFHQLDGDGKQRVGVAQELFATTRLIHSFAIGKLFGIDDCDAMVDHGMRYLRDHHHDPLHGGYVWSLKAGKVYDDRKLAYGHAFVLLAAASAKQAGHPYADAVLDDIEQVLQNRFWEKEYGLFSDEANRDWTPFSSYRGFNANMHSTEALLAAYEATGKQTFLQKAGQILEYFVYGVAAQNNHRIPEHYFSDWSIDSAYAGNPMFRPAGTTPGHSFEFARLLLQHWDLSGRSDSRALIQARKLVERALSDAWDVEKGGFFYTMKLDGTPDNKSRYWWPVTEAIGVLATLIKLERNPKDEEWYRRIWQFADDHFVDHENGGWHPEIDDMGGHTDEQFKGKPDIYHSLQAALFSTSPSISRFHEPLGKNAFL